MPTPRNSRERPPLLVEAYVDRGGATHLSARTVYLQRWDQWHARVCGRPECLKHTPTVRRTTP
jgi:hypothetical protein